MTGKSISIKGVGCKFGGCALKAIELTSGDLLFVPESGLRGERSLLTGRQKSAEGVVVRNGRRPERSSVRRVMGAVSKRRDS